MDDIYNIYEAKTNLSELVERAVAGEEIIIAKAGVPKVRLVPVPQPKVLREPSGSEGKVWYAPDWDASMTDEELGTGMGRTRKTRSRNEAAPRSSRISLVAGEQCAIGLGGPGADWFRRAVFVASPPPGRSRSRWAGGKLRIDGSFEAWVGDSGFLRLSDHFRHAEALGRLPLTIAIPSTAC